MAHPASDDTPRGWADLSSTATPATLDRCPAAPFVLLDDARPEGSALLFRRPAAVIATDVPGAVPDALARLRAGLAAGRHAAGYLTYEAGLALEPRLRALLPPRTATPLLWFGLFGAAEPVCLPAMPAAAPPPAPAPLRHRPGWSEAQHAAAVARILALVGAGDCYQINLTFPSAVAAGGDGWATYRALRHRQRAGWGGIVETGETTLLSCSPELFFALDDGRLSARPMKGTAPRARDPARDSAAAAALRTDAKERAENLMIVDLLRNDLARIAVPGSVRVPHLFEVETYPTVHQLTSTVTARLAPGRDAVDVLAATFPCGSITGAPKLRAMEIIHAAEAGPRGAYTGSMGWIAPDGTAAFNVLIRTLERRHDAVEATLGLGSAIVADSDPAAEWAECAIKAAFVGG